MTTVRMERSAVCPGERMTTYLDALRRPVPSVFNRRVNVFPPVVAVRHEPVEWGTIGQSRVLMLGDRSQMREELIEVVPGEYFAYVLSDITGPFRFLVHHVDGRWAVDETAEGQSRLTWSWELTPTHPAAVAPLRIVARLWQKYARHALDQFAEGPPTAEE